MSDAQDAIPIEEFRVDRLKEATRIGLSIYNAAPLTMLLTDPATAEVALTPLDGRPDAQWRKSRCRIGSRPLARCTDEPSVVHNVNAKVDEVTWGVLRLDHELVVQNLQEPNLTVFFGACIEDITVQS